jgi:hypothetical protein
MHFTSPTPAMPPSKLQVLLAALMGMSAGISKSFPWTRQGPSEPGLSRRLTAAKRTFDQWAHNMIVSPTGEIALHNSTVKRRNRRFAAKKGLA